MFFDVITTDDLHKKITQPGATPVKSVSWLNLFVRKLNIFKEKPLPLDRKKASK